MPDIFIESEPKTTEKQSIDEELETLLQKQSARVNGSDNTVPNGRNATERISFGSKTATAGWGIRGKSPYAI